MLENSALLLIIMVKDMVVNTRLQGCEASVHYSTRALEKHLHSAWLRYLANSVSRVQNACG